MIATTTRQTRKKTIRETVTIIIITTKSITKKRDQDEIYDNMKNNVKMKSNENVKTNKKITYNVILQSASKFKEMNK